MTPFEFLLIGLATWRLSYMLVGEDGPWRVFRRLREATGITHDEYGHILMVPERTLPELLSCVWCTSVWVAGGFTLAWYLIPGPVLALSTALGMSSLAIGVNRVMGRML